MHANPTLQQAQQIVSFLTPFLPYLIAGAKEVAKGMAKKVGELEAEKAWDKAQQLWDRLKGTLTRKQKVKADVIAIDPTDEQEIVSFARTLLETLESDPELVAELASLLPNDESVQKVIAHNRTLIAKVVQKGPGTKIIEGTDDSTIIDVHQES